MGYRVNPTKEQIQAFERKLDAELARRPSMRFDANKALMLACNLVEAESAKRPMGGFDKCLSDGIETFAPYFVSGRSGAEPDAEQLIHDLIFGAQYHHIRELLYYSYNVPDAIDWTFAEGRIELRFRDRSIPRQFFTVWNEHVFLSMKTFDGFTAPDELRRILKGAAEWELGEAHEAADRYLQEYANRKLAAYFSLLDPSSDVDLGGYTYRAFYAVYRVMMQKALYHRYQAELNDAIGCIHMDATALMNILVEETGVDVGTVAAILKDLIYDVDAVKERVDPAYFSMMKEGAAPNRVIMRPFDFSKADGLIQLLRVVAQRRPRDFLSNVSNALGSQLVRRAKVAFETQGFLCRVEVSLAQIDPLLPDIDLLVIAEEPTLGYAMLICEIKSPLPPRWAKDQLRVLAKDGVSKAFRQVEAISEFLKRAEGIDFIRSVLPEGGLEHFKEFVTVIDELIITSDNAGMFFGHEETPIINFRTLERLLDRSDGDILHIRTCIKTYNEGADTHLKTVMAEFEVGDLTVFAEGFTPTTLIDFPQNKWRGSPQRQQLIDDFVAGGYHPFDCLTGHEVRIAPTRTDDGEKDAAGSI
jgi:hypothetical protein